MRYSPPRGDVGRRGDRGRALLERAVLPDEAPTVHAAADEILSLRREREAMGAHVVRDLRRVLAAWFLLRGVLLLACGR
jgi:hypothetical protein